MWSTDIECRLLLEPLEDTGRVRAWMSIAHEDLGPVELEGPAAGQLSERVRRIVTLVWGEAAAAPVGRLWLHLQDGTRLGHLLIKARGMGRDERTVELTGLDAEAFARAFAELHAHLEQLDAAERLRLARSN